MNDLHHPCELWAERISLAAADCLSPDEQREVQRHIETCAACRESYRQLVELCGALVQARFPADDAEEAAVARIMSAVADQSQRPIAGKSAEMIHRRSAMRFPNNWRWIMRSPLSRIAAAVIFVIAVGGVALWFHGAGATRTFADFIGPILEAKTAKFKMTAEMKGPPAVTTTSEVMVLDATRQRQELEITMPDKSKSKAVMIFDWGRGKGLMLDPNTKKAVVYTLANISKERLAQEDMFGWFRSVLLDARDKPDVKREPLGETEIDGRRVVGFRVSIRGTTLSLWGDPQTGLPVRAEMTMAMYAKVKSTLSDFTFNMAIDESLFSTEPPPGYTVQNMKIDVSQPEEKDLIKTFRTYSELSGGAFPDSLDTQPMMETTGKMIGMKIGKKLAMQTIREKLTSGKRKLSEEQIRKVEELMDKFMEWQFHPEKRPSEKEMNKLEEEMRKTAGMDEGMKALAGGMGKMSKEEVHKNAQDAAKKSAEAGMQEFAKVQMPLQRGLLFVFSLPANADAHYAGKGVKLGAADRPIFWYRPKNAKKYRVIYADLSVRDADAPPNVPNAQPAPAAAAKK
jgi:outer membrane lipoprotein-sorting protein